MTLKIADIHAKAAETIAEGAFFEVETRNVAGRDYRVYKHAPATLVDVLQSGRNHGDLEFMIYEGERISYNEFYARADALASVLQNRFEIAKGDRVAIAMRNNPQWAIAYAAATLIGAIVVPINSWGKTDELSYAINDCRPKVLVCDAPRLRLLDGIFDDFGIDAVVAGEGSEGSAGREHVHLFDELIADGRGGEYVVDAAQPEDSCVILYTSGSTGFPKGVVHRHIAACQSLMNMMWLGMLLMELEGARELRGGAERETPILTVPLFHCTGLLSGFLLPLQTAQKVVMMYKWDTVKALDLIQNERVTTLSSVPAIVMDLLSHPEFDNFDTSSLLRVTGAGAATPAGMPELIESKVGNPSRSAGYGMTETMAVASTMSGAIYDVKPDAAGIVSPIMDFRFRDADGELLPQGEAGAIELRGVTVTPGYWEKPAANAEVLDADGWLKTGDVGLIDGDGFVHITGRTKEIVIRGGENIFPGEIENVAYEHDAVHEVVVFGIPDVAMGEELAMMVYRKPGTALDEAALRAYLSDKLAGYKVPKVIAFSDHPLPRNASEKLHKLKVKEQYLEANSSQA